MSMRAALYSLGPQPSSRDMRSVAGGMPAANAGPGGSMNCETYSATPSAATISANASMSRIGSIGLIETPIGIVALTTAWAARSRVWIAGARASTRWGASLAVAAIPIGPSGTFVSRGEPDPAWGSGCSARAEVRSPLNKHRHDTVLVRNGLPPVPAGTRFLTARCRANRALPPVWLLGRDYPKEHRGAEDDSIHNKRGEGPRHEEPEQPADDQAAE